MASYVSKLALFQCAEKRVFLRVDLNVPLKGEYIEDDFKLKAIQETLNFLLKKKCTVILATHIDRPDHPQPEFSTRHLVPWFIHHGYHIQYCATLEEVHQKTKQNQNTILLLENLRFFPGEIAGGSQFALQLRSLADFYVNDAFGMLHRHDCSVVALPELFEPSHKTFGFLIEKELSLAQKLLHPKPPFCLLVGGGKGEDKFPFIQTLLPKLDSLLLCPGIDRIFIQNNLTAESIQSSAQKERILIELPEDYLVGKSLTQGPFIIKKKSQLSNHDFTISIGPETQKKYASLIRKSKTVFYNGLMGTLENSETLTGIHAIFTAMQECDFALVGGGDSTAAARKLGFEKSLHLSTGGGSLLAYLSNQKLPALEALFN